MRKVKVDSLMPLSMVKELPRRLSWITHTCQIDPPDREETLFIQKCRGQQGLEKVVFPLLIANGGLLSYFRRYPHPQARYIHLVTSVGVYSVGSMMAVNRCTKLTLEQFPNGSMAQLIAAKKEALLLRQNGVLLSDIYPGGPLTPPPAAPTQPARRLNDDYMAGFADTDRNVQFKGLNEENRKTVDDDQLYQKQQVRQSDGPRRQTYAELRAQNREGARDPRDSGQTGYGSISGVLNPQQDSQAPQGSRGAQWYSKPTSDAKPVRRNKYGDIIEDLD